MTIYFSNYEIEIYRNRRIGSSDRWTMSATFTVYQADIQPEIEERIQLAGGQVGKTYVGFVDSSCPVEEGDLIVVGDDRYAVNGVNLWSGAGLLDHKELSLVKED